MTVCASVEISPDKVHFHEAQAGQARVFYVLRGQDGHGDYLWDIYYLGPGRIVREAMTWQPRAIRDAAFSSKCQVWPVEEFLGLFGLGVVKLWRN